MTRLQGFQPLADLVQSVFRGALNSSDATWYSDRGIVHYYLGDYSAAMRDYDRALALNPSHASAYKNRAITYYAQGNCRMAMVAIRRSLELSNTEAIRAWLDWIEDDKGNKCR